MAIRTRVIRPRRSTQRKIPTRTGKLTARATSTRTIGSIAREQRTDQEYINFLGTSTNNFIGSISNVSTADAQANKFIRDNINTVDQKFKSNFIVAVRQATNNIKNAQSNEIKFFNTYTSNLQKDYDGYRDLAKKARAKGRDDTRYKSKYKGISTMQSETAKILARLKSGERLERNNVVDFIKQSGRARTKKVKLQISKRTALAKGTSINTYVQERALLRRAESIETIKEKLNVNVAQAKKIQKEINNAINTRTTALDEVKENVILGAKYTDKELEKAGFTAQDIKETKMVRQLESKRQESLLKSFDNVKPVLPDLKVYSTIANAIISTIPKNKVKSVVVQTEQQKLFNRLSKRDKDLITSYQAIKALRDEAPSLTDLNRIKGEHRLLGGAKDYAKDIKNTKTRAEVIDVINNASLITDAEVNNVLYITKQSNNDIRKLLIANKDSKINSSLKALNKFFLASDKNINVRQKQLRNIVKGKLDAMFKEGAKTPPAVVFHPVKALTLWAKLKYVEDLKKKGTPLTRKEFEEVKASLDDTLGLKQGYKNINNFKPKGLASLVPRDLYFYFKVTEFLVKSLYQGAKKTGQFLKFIIDISKLATKLISPTAIKVKSWGSKSAKDLFFESSKAISDVVKKLPKKDKDKLFAETKKNFSAIPKGIKGIDWALKHYDTIIVGAGVLAGIGLLSLRRTMLKSPEKVFGEVLSYVIIGESLEGIKFVGQLAKAKFSPFVLRNVKVFSEAPTKITTAEALKRLQGKKVNLFTATGDDVAKLFKGVNLNSKDKKMLIKAMRENPNLFIGANKKIKNLTDIIKSSPKRSMIKFLKNNDAILSGSASLRLQLKSFRAVGDFDIIANNSRVFGKKLVEFMNKDVWFGSIAKKTRYVLTKNKRGFYGIVDKLTGKQIADIIDKKQAIQNIQFALGRKFSTAKDLITIDGVKILKIETQLPLKLSLTDATASSFRAGKELKDVKLILQKANKSLLKKQYGLVKKLFEKNKNIMNVKGFVSGMGKDRKWFWVKKYGIDPTKLSSSQIKTRLKRIGFTQAKIDNNINTLSPDGLFMGINKVYPYFLGNKGGVIYMKAQKISKFPTALAKRLKDNHSGLLNNIKKLKLRKDLNRYIKANPDKVFPGEKALIDAIGEEEALLPVLSILFKKKTLVKREIWISELRKFIIAQEATIGKPPLSVFKRLANAFRGKVKGKSLKQLKKEIGAWAKGNFDDFAKSGKGIIGSKKASLNFIKKQQAILDDEIKQIRKLKIPIKNKNELIKNLRRAKKRIDVKKVLGRRIAIANIVRRSITKVRKSTRIAKRVVKRTARPVKRVVKGRKRVIKRVVTLKARPRARTKTRPRKRVPIRPRTTVRPRARVPVRPRARVPVRPRPRIKPPKKPPGKILPPIIDLNWDSKLRRGENLLVNARVRVKGKNRLIRLKTTPNRAYKRMVRLIDNTTSRSFELIVIGKAMKKDIKKQSLVKFRSKKSRASKVLKIVEKTRFAIDTKGEKSGLTIARALRKKTTKKKKRKVNKKVKRKKKRSVKK